MNKTLLSRWNPLLKKHLFSQFLLLFLFANGLFAQTCPTSNINPDLLTTNCRNDNYVTAADCTSKDLEVVGAFLGDGKSCITCTFGETITAPLTLSIFNKTGSTRTAFSFWGTLEITDGTTGVKKSCPIARCAGPVPPDGTYSIPFGDITYKCGDALKLTNLFLAWTDAAPGSTCASLTCDNLAPKCGTVAAVDIKPALFVKLASSVLPCEGESNGSITMAGFGGTAPYSYTLNGMTNGTGTFSNLAAGTYTVTIKDAAGCTASTSVNLAFQICCKLEVTCPAENGGTYSCLADVPKPDLTVNGLIKIGDKPCGTVKITSSDSYAGTGCAANVGIVTRTYTIKDDKTTMYCVQKFTVKDETKPVITAKAIPDITVCNSNPTTDITYNATATDNCGGTVTPTTTGWNAGVVDGCIKTYTRTWTATDACGNAADPVNQTVKVKYDVTKPVITVANFADVTTCNAAISTVTGSMATVKDACDAGVTTTASAWDAGVVADCWKTYTRTWSATDACGNTADTKTQSVRIRHDVTKPVITVANFADVTTCNAAISTVTGGTATVEDNCTGTITLTPSNWDAGVVADCWKTYTRTWTATDACGNAADSKTQTVRIKHDMTKPEITVPAIPDVTVCNAAITTVTGYMATVKDACDAGVTTTASAWDAGVVSDCWKTYTRTWSAKDACGNVADTKTQSVKIRYDVTKPEFTATSLSKTLTCDQVKALTADFSTVKPTATDNCGAVTITLEKADKTNLCSTGKILLTWKAEDACKNTNTAVQTISISGYVAVNVTASATCVASGPFESGTLTATASNGCAPYSFKWSDSKGSTTQTVTGAGNGTYTVTVTDGLGCTKTASVTVSCKVNTNLCTYSMGGFGQAGGNIGTRNTCDAIKAALAAAGGTIKLGSTTTGKYILINSAACVDAILPSSGSPSPLTSSYTCGNCPDKTVCTGTDCVTASNYNNIYKNSFLGQTLTMTLNVLLYPELGNVQLKYICGLNLSGISGDLTINQLLVLANNTLGGVTTYPSASALTSVFGSIIDLLHGCKNPCVTTTPSTSIAPTLSRIAVINLEAKKKETGVELNWYSNLEQEGDNYQIERSTNGGTFTTVQQIDAKNFSQDFINYTYLDTQLEDGLQVYRVNHINQNGDIVKTSTAKVIAQNVKSSFSVFPNPADNEVIVNLNEFRNTTVTIQLINELGVLVQQKEINQVSSDPISLDISQLQSGLYFINIKSSNYSSETKKLFITH